MIIYVTLSMKIRLLWYVELSTYGGWREGGENINKIRFKVLEDHSTNFGRVIYLFLISIPALPAPKTKNHLLSSMLTKINRSNLGNSLRLAAGLILWSGSGLWLKFSYSRIWGRVVEGIKLQKLLLSDTIL